MSPKQAHIRHGIGSVRPYLYGRLDLPDLLKKAFGAEELERLPVGNKGFHIETKIGDSMVVVEVGDPPHPGGTRASIYVYVKDVDAAYRRAIAAGQVGRRAVRQALPGARRRHRGFVWKHLVHRNLQRVIRI